VTCAPRGDPDRVPPSYEIRLICQDGVQDDVFDDLTVIRVGSVLFLRGCLDQSALHGVLERIRVAGWQVLDVRRVRSTPRAEAARG
jgi:hypothetical protein